jgi:hypothetical protein
LTRSLWALLTDRWLVDDEDNIHQLAVVDHQIRRVEPDRDLLIKLAPHSIDKVHQLEQKVLVHLEVKLSQGELYVVYPLVRDLVLFNSGDVFKQGHEIVPFVEEALLLLGEVLALGAQ